MVRCAPVVLACCVLIACGGDGPTGASSATTPTSSTAAGAGGSSTTSGVASTAGAGGGGGRGGAGPVETVPFVYVGASDDAISVFLLDRETGALAPLGKVDAGAHPSFLATDPQHRWIFAVNEGSGEVASFSIDPATGLVTEINRKSSEGGGPAYVSVDATGSWALVANYGGGTVAVLPIQADGSLGDAVDVEAPGQNCHLIRTDLSNQFAFVPDLGSDHVAQFLFDAATGELTPNDPPSVATAPGAEPRHLELHPDLPVVYVINEAGDSVATYAMDAQGRLTESAVLPTLPGGADPDANYCADLHIAPDGAHLYGSNRGHDSLVVYDVDAAGGLSVAGHHATGGQWPRNFGIDPEGGIALVANQHSSTVVTFRVDAATGALTELVTTPTDGEPAWVGVVTQPLP